MATITMPRALMLMVRRRMRSMRSRAIRAITVSTTARRPAAMSRCLNVVKAREGGSQVGSMSWRCQRRRLLCRVRSATRSSR